MSAGGTSTTVTQAADPWYKGQASQLYSQGVDFLNRTPYSSYGGPQVAGFQPAQFAAQDFLARQLYGQPLPYAAPHRYGPFAGPGMQFKPYTAAPGGADPGGYKPGDDSVDTGRDAKPRDNGGGGGGGGGVDGSWVGGGVRPRLPPTGLPVRPRNFGPDLPPSDPFRAAGATPDPGGPLNRYAAAGGPPPPGGGATLGGGRSQAEWDTLLRDDPEAYQQWLNNSTGPGRGFGSYSTVVDPATGNQTQTNTYYNTNQAALDAWRAGGMKGLPPGAQAYGTQVGTADSGGRYTWNPLQQMAGSSPPPGGIMAGPGWQSGFNDAVPPPPGPPGVVPPPPQPPTDRTGTYGAPGTGINEAQDAAEVARRIANQGGPRDVTTGDVTGGINRYRDPYENAVVDRSLLDLDRSRQLATQDARSAATRSGAFGGDRAALLEAETNRGYADAAARTIGQLRSQGFDRAASLAQQDAERALAGDITNQGAWFNRGNQNLAGAGLLSSLGGDIFGRTVGTANALSGLGAQQQGQAQDEIGADMAQFYDAQQDPYRRFGFLGGLLSGVPQGMNQTTYTPRGSRGAGFLGGALSGAGAGSAFGPWGAGIGAGLGGLLGLF